MKEDYGIEKVLQTNCRFVTALYETVVIENGEDDLEIYENSKVKTNDIEEYPSAFYNSLTEIQKKALLELIEQTRVDTISHILGIIDGSSTITDFELEPKLILGTIDTDNMLQDVFLEYIEERESKNENREK